MKPRNKKVNYMDKKLVHEAFIERVAACKEAEERGEPKPQISPVIAKAMMDVATNAGKNSNYCLYSWRDDMVNMAMVNMVAKADKYDINRPEKNPYAFLSRIAETTFFDYIRIEKKNYMTNKKFRIETQPIDTLSDGDVETTLYAVDQQSSNESNALAMELYYQEISEVANYDRLLEEQKEKRKKRAAELKALRKKESKQKTIDL